jgi:hypothetical protein
MKITALSASCSFDKITLAPAPDYRWIIVDPDGDVIDGISTFDWT